MSATSPKYQYSSLLDIDEETLDYLDFVIPGGNVYNTRQELGALHRHHPPSSSPSFSDLFGSRRQAPPYCSTRPRAGLAGPSQSAASSQSVLTQ